MRTALRERYVRALRMDEAGWTRDCVEYLEHPEILVAEFSDSHLAAEAWEIPDDPVEVDFDAPMRRVTDGPVQKLMDTPQVNVRATPPFPLHYLAREVSTFPVGPNASEAERRRVGVSYIGLVAAPEPVCVLGVVDPDSARAPYVSLLRLLTCLAEMSATPQFDYLDERVLKGALGSGSPTFELQILAAGAPPEPVSPLGSLTCDLAHSFASHLREEWEFPDLVRAIRCVRMDVEAFAGELSVDWSASEDL